jgi:ankyrin repeat protein
MRYAYLYICLFVLLLLRLGYFHSTPPTEKGTMTARQQLEHRGIPYNRAIFLREAADGNTAVVELFLAAGMDPNVKNLAHETALWKAAEYGHLDTAKALLAKGADVNAKDVWDITPLMKAAEHGSPTLARLFLANGADVQAKDNLDRTAFERGRAHGHSELLQFLTAADTAPSQLIQQEAKP